MSENQKLYEEFIRKCNLTTPTPLLALEYKTPASTQTIPTISFSTEGQYTSANGSPDPMFDSKELDLEGLSVTYWTPFILYAVVPALVFLIFYVFHVLLSTVNFNDIKCRRH